jgi:fructosamine-3-kinase
MLFLKTELEKEIKNLSTPLMKITWKNAHLLRPLKSGRKNSNYLFSVGSQKYILRINEFRDYNHSKKEFLNLKLVNKLFGNSPIFPKPICYKKKGKYIDAPYIIITFLEGKPFTVNKKCILLLIKDIVRFNNIKFDYDPKKHYFLRKSDYKSIICRTKDKEKYISDISKELGKIIVNIRRSIEKKKLKNLDQINCLLHGDLNTGNILYYKSTLKYIDLESLKFGDPITDIVVFFLSLKKSVFEKYKEYFFKEYITLTNDLNIKERFEYYIHFQKYLWFIYSLKNLLKSKAFKVNLLSSKKTYKNLKNDYKYLKEHGFVKEDILTVIKLIEKI